MSTYCRLKGSLYLALLVLSLSHIVYSAEPNPPAANPSEQSEVERLQRDLRMEKDRGVAFQRLIARGEQRSNELEVELNRLRERCKADSTE